MNETHDNALFIQPEEGVHDGCFLYTKPRCPIKLAQLNARLAALGEPSEQFKLMTQRMALLRPTETSEEWDRIVVAESTKGGDAVPASNSSQST